jgi:hypothetical protein
VAYGPVGGVASHDLAGFVAPSGMQRPAVLNGLAEIRLRARLLFP